MQVKNLGIIKPVWQVLGLGVLAGMRSMSAPALASHILGHQHSKSLGGSPLNFMQSEKVANVLKVMAIGEFVGDKLPSAPDRIKPFGLAGRCLSGALAGASIFKATGGKWLTGALLGATVAVASAYGSYYLRKGIVEHTSISDPFIGAIEDALVVGAGMALTQFS